MGESQSLQFLSSGSTSPGAFLFDPSPLPPTPLRVLRIGRSSYRETWDLQKKLQRDLLRHEGHDTLILCEHEPVITQGRSAKNSNVRASSEALARRGIEVIPIERGGDVTYHGPGQLVAYPILDLNRKRRDVGWYMRGLEEVILRCLANYGINATRIAGKTGVWLKSHGARDRKIASLGVRISRWCTLHGLALNVRPCTEGFSLINPCGFTDIAVTSMAEELPPNAVPALDEVAEALLQNFLECFSFFVEVVHGA
jgi:lipoyl(octanoyl) transferase